MDRIQKLTKLRTIAAQTQIPSGKNIRMTQPLAVLHQCFSKYFADIIHFNSTRIELNHALSAIHIPVPYNFININLAT